MGRFKHLVDSPAGMEGFRAKYHIPQGVVLEYCPPNQVLTDRDVGQVVIPLIAFIEGGIMLPMGRITRDYLFNHRLTPHQCAPNLFRVLGCVDVMNEQLGLGLTWHDVVHMYKCHKLSGAGYYLKSRSEVVRLISNLPKSNKGMKDDYLIVSREWSNSLYCPTQAGDPGGVPLGLVPLEGDLVFLALFFFLLAFHLFLAMIFVDLTMISVSDISADKNHVAPRLSHTNVQALNYLLGLKIFVSEDGQLRAAPLILDYKPLSRIFQDIGQAIRAKSSRLARIDVSKPGFLARRDLPPVTGPFPKNLPQATLSLPQTLPEAAAVPAEEITSSRISLE